MRRSISGLVFILVVAASAASVVLLLSASVIQVAQAQVRPGRGGGGAAGVSLQAATPGAKQTGHANISGTVIIGPANLDTKLVASGGTSGGLDISSPANANAGWIRLGGCSTAAQPCLSTTNNTSLVLGAPSNPVAIDTGGITRGAGNLLEVRNNGVIKFSVDASGTPTTAAVFNTGVQTVGAINGSLCTTLAAASPAPSGLIVGSGCIASQGSALPDWGGQSIALTLSCDVVSATSVKIRICNTGTNTYTPPPNTTYYARIIK